MKYWKLFLRAIFSLTLITYLASRIHWKSILPILSNSNKSLMLCGAILTPIGVLLMSYRLKIILESKDFKVSFWRIAAVTWTSQFFNTFLPGSTGGDVYKIIEVSSWDKSRRNDSIACIIADRVFALIALVCIATISIIIFPLPWTKLGLNLNILDLQRLNTLIKFLLGLFIITLILFIYIRSSILSIKFINPLLDIIKTIGSFYKNKWLSIKMLSLSSACHFIMFFVVYILARALGINIHFYNITAFIPALTLLLMMPITINGHGLREIFLVAYFQWLNLTGFNTAGSQSQEWAIALSLT